MFSPEHQALFKRHFLLSFQNGWMHQDSESHKKSHHGAEDDDSVAIAIRRNKAYNLEVSLAVKKLVTVGVIVTALVLCLLYCHKCLWGVVVYSGCHCRDSPIVLGVFMISLPVAVMAISPILLDGGILVAETIHSIHKINQ